MMKRQHNFLVVSTSQTIMVTGVIFALALLTVTSSASPLTQTAGGGGAVQKRSTFVSIRLFDRCSASVEEVIPTEGNHLTEFVAIPADTNTPFHFSEHVIDESHFGTISATKEFYTMRVRMSYTDPLTQQEMIYVQPDPRVMFLDVHREGTRQKKDSATEADDADHHHEDHHGGHHHHHHNHHQHAKDNEVFGDESDDTSFTGENVHILEEGTLMVWIPNDVDSLRVACANLSTQLALALPVNPHTNAHETTRKHFFEEAVADASIQMKTVRSIGPPDRVNNVVFLADGFLQSENGSFWDHVETIVNLITQDLTEPTPCLFTQQWSVPMDRYLHFWNVYGVFQASQQEGASIPGQNKNVNDNLKCYHTPQLMRAISCDRSLAQALARVSPAPVLTSPDNVLIIVIVNTPIYGGTGLYQKGVIHIGHFFNGTGFILGDNDQATGECLYASLINHECGHAYGQLLDEYNIGTTMQPPYTNWSNCLQPNADGTSYRTPIPWQHWIDVYNTMPPNQTQMDYYTAGNSASAGNFSGMGYGTDAGPSQVCGYSNYFKGSQRCMMNALDNYFMCPQCREGYSKVLFTTGFEYQWPRYPLADHVLLISRTDPKVQGIAAGGVTLHLPMVLQPSYYYAVQWFDQNGTAVVGSTDPACPACLFIPNTTLALWPNDTMVTYTAKIWDNSYYIHDSKRANFPFMVQNASFRMIIPSVEAVPTVFPANSGSSSSSTSNSASGNSTNSTTFTNTTVMQYQPAVIGGDAPAFGAFNGFAGAIDKLPINVLCIASRPGGNLTCTMAFTQNSYNFPGNLDSLSQYDSYVLYILGGVGLLFVLLWIYAALRYKKVSGRVVRPIFKTEFSTIVTLIRRIMMSSSILFMFGAVGALVTAGYFYTKTSFIGKISIIGGVLVSLCLYLMAFVGFWAITNRAKRLVMFNGIIMILAECVLVALLVLTNVIGETINDDGTVWSQKLTAWWTGNVATDPATACGWEGMLQCSGWGDFPCNGIFYVDAYCPTNCKTYNSQYSSSCQFIIRSTIVKWYPIVAGILGMCVGLMGFAVAFNYIYYFSLWHMKKKIRERNDERVYRSTASRGISRGDVDKAKALHVLRSLDVGDLQHLVVEFKRIDEDGNGTLSKKELGLFFRKALCYKISLPELDKIFDAMDIDGDGSISIDEFLAVFRPEDAAQGGGGGGLLKYPANAAGEIPLMESAQMDRQRRVRERLASQFEGCGVEIMTPAVPQGNIQHASFQPQAFTIAINQQPQFGMGPGRGGGLGARQSPHTGFHTDVSL